MLQNDLGTAIVFSAFIFVLYREGLSGNILIFGLCISVLFIISIMFNKYTIIICLAVLFLILLIISKRKKKDIIALLSIFTICSVFVLSSNYIFNNVLAKHQKERINVLIKKDIDPHGSGYNLIQSKIAIGSGGTLGKGFLNGTQTRFDFVPEQSTDFIFCTIGEEWGFLGSIVFILLFTGLLLRILFLAERQRSNFSRIYGYSVATILFALF